MYSLSALHSGEYDAMAVAQGLAVPESVVVGKKKVERKVKKKVGIVLPGTPTSSSVEESAGFESGKEEAGGSLSTWDLPAISLPNGCNSLPTDLIPLLERFSRIYLWLDNDKSGECSAERYNACSVAGFSAVECPVAGADAELGSCCCSASNFGTNSLSPLFDVSCYVVQGRTAPLSSRTSWV